MVKRHSANDDSAGPPSATPGAPELAPLLRWLESAGQPAALSYERLRYRLIVYFRLHWPAEAEALADTSFDRIARKLQEGTQIRDLAHYALGVARMVGLETAARARRWRDISDDPDLQPEAPAEPPDEDDEAALAALRACLEQLEARSSALILGYYSGEGAARRHARSRLAAELGVSINSLRNRALRIREALETCVRRRLQAP